MRAQCRVFSACSHLPLSVPPCSSPFSLCQRQIKAQQQRGPASQELSALKTENGEKKMGLPLMCLLRMILRKQWTDPSMAPGRMGMT